jgi:hypothetical protein
MPATAAARRSSPTLANVGTGPSISTSPARNPMSTSTSVGSATCPGGTMMNPPLDTLPLGPWPETLANIPDRTLGLDSRHRRARGEDLR